MPRLTDIAPSVDEVLRAQDIADALERGRRFRWRDLLPEHLSRQSNNMPAGRSPANPRLPQIDPTLHIMDMQRAMVEELITRTSSINHDFNLESLLTRKPPATPINLRRVLVLLKQTFIGVHHTGSRYICNPPVMNTDDDWFIQIADKQELISETVTKLTNAGFSWDGGEHYQHIIGCNFMSFSKAPLNILISANEEFTAKHKAATAFCKRLNVLAKPDRIKIFRSFLYAEQMT